MQTVDNNKSMLDEYSKYMLPVLDFRKIVITKGKGSYVWDANGDKYLDLNSGQFCAVFGHSDANIAEEIFRIANKIQDTDTSTLSEDVLIAAKKIHEICPEMNARTIFLSTGAEANECALRYAKHLKEKNGIISFDMGYHGLSHGTAAYSMSRARIRPTVEYSYAVSAPRDYGDNKLSEKEIDKYVDEFEKMLSENIDNIAAAIFEPIISGGGLIFPPKSYFKKVAAICKKYDVFLIFDECQTGFGRTGTWFYYQQLECVPDFLVAAKAIGLGYPVSCVIANGNTIKNDLFVLQHYSSHQNEPFAARIVSFGIETMIKNNMLESNIENGNYLMEILKQLAKKHSVVSAPRGVGLMCGFDLFKEVLEHYKEFGTEFCKKALNYKILLQHCNNGKTIRILPNYKMTKTDIDFLYENLDAMISENF